MTNKIIVYNIENNIAFLTLSNPPSNTMNRAFFELFGEIIEKIILEKNLKGLIINSKGRHFSSGADVDELFALHQTLNNEIPETIKKNAHVLAQLSKFEFPVISCLKGICYGSGFELALFSHIRIASENTLVCLPETSFGLIPGLAGILHSVQCAGKAKTLEFVLSGNPLSASEALESNMIDLIVDKNLLTQTAIEIISKIEGEYVKEFKHKYIPSIKRQYL